MFDVTPHLLAFDGTNPSFVKAYKHFIQERGEYYHEHFSNEYCMDTYYRNRNKHSLTDPPFIIALDVRNQTRSPFVDRKYFNSMVNVFDGFRYDLSYYKTGSNFQITRLHLSTFNHSSDGYLSIPLGQHRHNDIHTFSHKEYVRHLIYYLLPEDYHYFKDCHEVFRRHFFLSVSGPARQNPLEG